MDLYRAIRIRALYSVTGPTTRDYTLRHIIRWYSKTFSTPVPQVETFPIEEILTAYYEEMYEGMTEEALLEEKAELLMTDEERETVRLEDDEDDALSYEMEKEEEKKKQKATGFPKALPSKNIAPVDKPVPIAKMASQESSLPIPVMPEMSMTFDLDIDDEMLSEDFAPMTRIKR